MNKSILAIALAVSMSSASAGGNSNNNGPVFGGDTTNNYNTTNNTTNKGGQGGNGYGYGVGVGYGQATSNAGAVAGASNTNNIGVSNRVGVSNYSSNYMEGQRQGQAQKQAQQQNSEQANAQSMTYNESEGMHYSGEYTMKNVPDAVAADISPTAPCAIPLTGAGSGVGFGLSLGTAYVDKNCEMREDVRLGLSGDSVSRSLANQVIQSRLRGHLDDATDEVASNAKSSGKSNYWDVASN